LSVLVQLCCCCCNECRKLSGEREMVLSASLYSTANQNPLSFHPLLSPFLYTQTEEAVVTFLWLEHMTDLNVYKPVKKPLCISIITSVCTLHPNKGKQVYRQTWGHSSGHDIILRITIFSPNLFKPDINRRSMLV